jgi:hypothetical protein
MCHRIVLHEHSCRYANTRKVESLSFFRNALFEIEYSVDLGSRLELDGQGALTSGKVRVSCALIRTGPLALAL